MKVIVIHRAVQSVAHGFDDMRGFMRRGGRARKSKAGLLIKIPYGAMTMSDERES